jgi:hypothetical protein
MQWVNLVLGASGEEGNQTAGSTNAQGVVHMGRGSLHTNIK